MFICISLMCKILHTNTPGPVFFHATDPICLVSLLVLLLLSEEIFCQIQDLAGNEERIAFVPHQLLHRWILHLVQEILKSVYTSHLTMTLKSDTVSPCLDMVDLVRNFNKNKCKKLIQFLLTFYSGEGDWLNVFTK